MKTLIRYILFAGTSLVFCACPYESKVPIDVPSLKILPELLGIWEDPKKSDDGIYSVKTLNPYQYKIEHALGDKTMAPEKFIGHLSRIDSSLFLNLFKTDTFPSEGNKVITKPGSSHSYSLYKLSYKGGILTLQELSNRITETFDSSVELESFIRRNQNKSFFYNKETILLINKYHIERIARQNAEMNRHLEVQKLQLKQSDTLNLVLAATLVLMLISTIFIWFYFHSRQTQARLATEKQQILAALNGQEAERKRIAFDLHDRLGSMLSTVKLYFNSVEESLEKFKENNRDQYTKANQLLDEACSEVRNISHDLLSGNVSSLGLLRALIDLKETINTSTQLQVDVYAHGMEKRLNAPLESSLYRIVQELLNNVIKHARATRVTVQLTRTGNQLNLIVEDDGIGFDINTRTKTRGLGIQSIQERLLPFSGTLKIDSSPGKGSTLIIDVPIL